MSTVELPASPAIALRDDARRRRRPGSLVRAGVAERLAVVSAATAVLWLAILWALA